MCVLQVVWGAGTGQLPEAPPGVSCRVVTLDQVCNSAAHMDVQHQQLSSGPLTAMSAACSAALQLLQWHSR